jgi:hypothetical protein
VVAEVVLAPIDKGTNIMYSRYYTMSFDELMQQQNMITKRYNAAFSSGASQEVMSQMLGHIEAIRHAMWELGYKQSFEANKNSDPFKDSII